MAIYVSVLNGGTNGHTVSGRDFTGVATDFISQGIVGAVSNTAGISPSSGGFAINQVGGGTTQQTQVTAGRCYITATPTSGISQTFQVEDTSGATLNHSANAGATAYDWIYAVLSATTLANPAVDASDPLSYSIVRSTSATSQTGTAPTYGILLAVVTVATSYTAITNANISDKRARAGAAASSVNPTATLPSNQLSNPYKFRVRRNAAFSSANGDIKIPFDTKDYDTSSNVDIVTNIGRFTAPVAGFYHFDAQVNLNTGSYVYAQLFKNGVLASRGNYFNASGISLASTVSDTLQLAAGDYVEVWANSNAINSFIVGFTYAMQFSGFLVSTL